MARKTTASAQTKKATASKSRQSSGKHTQESAQSTQAHHGTLRARLITAVVLVFLALFLILSMIGIHALILDFLKTAICGLLGYGFWPLPLILLYIAWVLFFLHQEPVSRRILSASLLPVSVSALLHTIICQLTFDNALISGLWSSGQSGASGGLLPGLLACGLQALVSRAGAIPILGLLTIILIFMALRLSATKIIHDQAERRRQQMPEPEEELPPPVYDTAADLRTLATPVQRQKVQDTSTEPRRQRSFDLPLGKSRQTASQRSNDTDELLVFGKQKSGKPATGSQQTSAFDISLSGDYTNQVQEMVLQNLEEDSAPVWEEPSLSDNLQSDHFFREITPQQTATTPCTNSGEPSHPFYDTASEADEFYTESLTEETTAASSFTTSSSPAISEAALDLMKEKKISKGEAAVAAVEVAMEIEARSDLEAQERSVYQYPPMTMLAEAMESRADNTEEMRTNVLRLEETLESFGVDTKICNVVRGPAVTRYEMELKPGVKMSKITSLHEDIALSLGVSGVHVAAVPGKSSTIGIEVPNAIVTSVPIKEVLGSKEFQSHKSALAFTAGKDISGNYIIGDIAKMPHLLIAGTTGSGKSVCMNSIIVSLLYRDDPEQCRLIMIDPKVVELSIYNGIPHLLIPVVTDPKKAAGALQWAVTEMDRRYKRFEDARVRDLAGYNKKAATDDELESMPRIVIIIDELADLMMVAAKEVETSIARLAAKARAAGMHLVIATQRPSADVITGVIKANIPSRIAFAVSSAMESNIIMGTRGAEKLLGKGDMFYAPQGADKPKRVQGCYISDEEVEKVAEFVKNASEVEYSQDIMQEIEQNASESASDSGSGQLSAIEIDGDELLPDAVEVILDTKQASVSMLQRRLKLGYAHAARIVDEMEEKGIVGPFEGSKPRQLLITREQWNAMVGINPRATATPTATASELDDDPPFDPDA